MTATAAGLHHRRLQRHRPGAGGPLPRGRLSAGAGGAAHRGDRGLGRQPAGLPPIAARSTAPTWRRSMHRRRWPHAASRRQGLPDVVIANAGISVGIDTADRADLDVLAQTFATNNVGLAATFHPFVAAMAARGSGRLVGIGSVAAIRGLPGHGAYCASKAGVVATAKACAAKCARAACGWSPSARATSTRRSPRANRYGMPFLMQPDDFAERAFRTIEAGQLPRDPLADGRGGQADATAAQCRVRPRCRAGPRKHGGKSSPERVAGCDQT
jgi:NAD(P)-dependent dehydrogenase (short-subunit alcohol dehydrogenase family)